MLFILFLLFFASTWSSLETVSSLWDSGRRKHIFLMLLSAHRTSEQTSDDVTKNSFCKCLWTPPPPTKRRLSAAAFRLFIISVRYFGSGAWVLYELCNNWEGSFHTSWFYKMRVHQQDHDIIHCKQVLVERISMNLQKKLDTPSYCSDEGDDETTDSTKTSMNLLLFFLLQDNTNCFNSAR